MAMPGKIALALRQCLEEAVANLISHTPPVAGEAIAVDLRWQGDDLVAIVEDRGPPFDLRAAQPIAHATTLEAVEPGGWGIQLIRAFATEIDYDTTPGCNRLILRFAGPGDPRTRPSGCDG